MYTVEEDKIIFKNTELFRHLPFLGSGGQGSVYKFRLGREFFAIKVFSGLEKEELENYQAKQNIHIESYVSPIKLLYINDKFKGYIMRFCKGKNLMERSLDISINEFAENTVKLMEDTHKLSILGYNIYDAYLTNVMYDDGFKMIDIDRYPYEPNKTHDEIERLNNIRLNLMLKDVFEKNTGLWLTDDEYIINLMKKCEKGDILFEEVFNKLCVRAYNIADTELTNISEIGKVLSKK